MKILDIPPNSNPIFSIIPFWEYTEKKFTKELQKIVTKRILEINLDKITKALHDLNWNELDRPYLEIALEININEKLTSDIPVYIRGKQIGYKSRCFTLRFWSDSSDSFTIEVCEYGYDDLIALSYSIPFSLFFKVKQK